jgi:hypothetical protein
MHYFEGSCMRGIGKRPVVKASEKENFSSPRPSKVLKE